MASLMPNICQYWSVDTEGLASEPGTCPNWDSFAKLCRYSGPGGAKADFYPLCNFLGTASLCAQYAGIGLQKTCILPDPSRHIINRRTGKKWVPLPELNTNDLLTTTLNFNDINGYNDGQCNGAGTQVTCSGYSPYILQFGVRQPDKEGVVDVTALDAITEYRLPLNYEIYNRRAALSPCYFWNAPPSDFSVADGLVVKPSFECVQSDEIAQKYNKFSIDKIKEIIVPPCNGAKAECPHYTGVCWQYCVDEKMRQGDKILAEQILELRWHIRKELWDMTDYYKIFEDPELFAWAGTVGITFETSTYQSKPLIPAIRTYISDFETMTINHAKLTLTEGTNADDYAKNYPTLVKELKALPLSPIIRNKFDKLNNTTNIFETGDFGHKYVLFIGDTFTSNTDVFALNLSDPDLFFISKKLQQYDSMYHIKMSMGKQFDEFYDKLCAMLDDIKTMMPDKVFRSELPSSGYMFYIPVETFWGYNKIIVMANTESGWEYDGIEIFKPYVGGVVAQTSFTIEGDGKDVPYLPAYENDFGAYNNKNGSITFKFMPMISYSSVQPTVAYAYIDGVRERLPANPMQLGDPTTYEFTYKLYRNLIEEDLVVDYHDMCFFGNAGYGFVFIPDVMKKLTNVTKPWEIEGNIFLVYGDGSLCEMLIHEQGTTRLPVNCFIIKPKDVNNFRSVCSDTFLSIPKLYIYERQTFDSSLGLEAEVIKEDFVEDDAVIQYRTNLSLTKSNDVFTLRDFGYESLMAAVLYRGPSGRIVGQTKTKLITFVRQPYCRDVEINYVWKAAYQENLLLPNRNCYGKTGISTSPDLIFKSYSPPCGDHDLSFWGNKGPMWYPYNSCEDFDRYRIYDINVFDYDIMEVFTDEQFDVDGNPVTHGSHDIRMLGPSTHFAMTGESHASLWACTCDWDLWNIDKVGDSFFTGYANYRGGIDGIAKLKVLNNSGAMPKFGNTYRDFLRSFRAMDNIDYYYFNGQQYTRRRKWVPMYEFYASAFSDNLSTYPYKLYSYSDYIEDNSMFVHPFGCYLATDVEGVSINEQIITSDEGIAERYKAEEIFRSHHSLVGLYYPMPKNPAQYLVGGNLIDVIPWYTYHDSPQGTDYSIQWAWREYWRDIKRNAVVPRLDFNLTYIQGHPVLDKLPEGITLSPYSGNPAAGRHTFLTIEYPDYRYDGFMKEHRLVCDEGINVITVTPPDMDVEEGEEEPNPNIWQAKLNDGPPRCFNIVTGEWVTASGEVGPGGDSDGKCSIELYDICTTDPWVTDVTLFDTGYNSEIPDPNRTISDYSENPAINTYYQRGLNVSIRAGALNLLPRKLIDAVDFEMRLSSAVGCAGENDNSDWFDADPALFFPCGNTIGLGYCDSDGTITATFHFPKPIKLAGLAVSYDYGAEVSTLKPSPTSSVTSGTIWHIPGIKVFRSEDDSVYSSIYSYDNMAIASKKEIKTEVVCFYDTHSSLESVATTNYMKIMWRVSPTTSVEQDLIASNEISTTSQLVYIANKVRIKTIHIYDSEFLEAQEQLNTYERLYNVSHGTHGDFPPHGYDSTGSLLYVLPNDLSTVYQRDSIGGTVGMPGSANDCRSMNKVRGRIMKSCHPDKERLEGSDLYRWEEEQKKIHDEIAINSGDTTITLKSISPPNMDYLFSKAGVRFPSWNCVLKNTLVAPLAQIEHYAIYNPGGHIFIRDLANTLRRMVCGRAGYAFGRSIEDAWEYAFKRFVDPDIKAKEIEWVVTAYFRRTGLLLIAPFIFLDSQFNMAQKLTNSIRASSSSNLSRYTYPEAAVSLY